tara:strand:- start:419 stop:1324 length:906 start_codon:yes stop_codon:yes gene_type:complete
MRITLFFTAALLGLTSVAQEVNFDAVALDSTGFWNGSDLSGGYTEEGFSFNNTYDSDWGSWSGFSISNVQDDTTAGWGNQYGVSTGEAYSGTNFALVYPDAYISFDVKTLDGFYITNSTYASESMHNGDAYAKKFGGEFGDDEDWFMVSVIGMLDLVVVDTLEFYLADFRFSDNSQDYILNDWAWLDLTPLGNVSSIRFNLSSSDMGEWGMNTPAYFCMDDLSVNDLALVEQDSNVLSIYPNPVKNEFRSSVTGPLSIYDLSGKLMIDTFVAQGNTVSVSDFKPGVYFVKMGASVQKIIKL